MGGAKSTLSDLAELGANLIEGLDNLIEAKLTKDQEDEVRGEMVKNGTPVRFMSRGGSLNILTGDVTRKGANVMHQTVYWNFNKATAKKIAKWLGARVAFSEGLDPAHRADSEATELSESGRLIAPKVANTILKQMGGWGRIRMMIGAKNAASYKAAGESKSGEGLGGVSFRFPRPGGGGRPNYVKIILNGKDLYDVSFGSIHGSRFKVTKTYNDVYASKLKSIFEKETGLYLSF